MHSDGDESDGQRKAEEEAMEADRMKRLDERQAQLDDITDPAAAMDVYEYQTHMVNYEIKGTFDDFNEMAIQYGYVALFSPCFPLAPFFSFLNNVTEIRGDAWKLCKAFQRPSARPRPLGPGSAASAWPSPRPSWARPRPPAPRRPAAAG